MATFKLFLLLLGILGVSWSFWVYLNPQTFMTNAGKKLTGKDFVDTENSVRANALSVGSAFFVLGTLLL
ncbi:MAG: hypothetical protein QNJ51_09045 [Calothrix sp. MO_167.B12]|nr:hypothetical protein [Calothrix sp. MO_167.B12]